MDDNLTTELERRLQFLESDSGRAEMVLADLPALDIAIATAGVVLMSLLLFWWAL